MAVPVAGEERAELPSISGAEPGRRLDVSARQGQRIMAAVAATE
jgi:hypothetical protein